VQSIRGRRQERFDVVAKTGEKAQKTGNFHCSGCSETVHVEKGEEIPPCPCGKNEFDTRTGEPGNKG
jgi:hypothetical protein